ncbi:hypothetical protein SPRG_04899 [Saprolegnia parasitica CBS 223.65]|uniref:Uncharacterized protein n=1 Tax=Saprolegnia parasitica (strain CBS 223.65) TaxID=695850 RepID=A0A067CGB5_SAPPC|nr:hypothetical protein SPRG_04899 [Saprolegnia parasitica CBS 223.65]KDO29784.1 hypothetical protein SPRG_04899 [Saprolegnia parasitica CBS 223.65]|eukprot:XP_012199429.1 hypothetical protein SPRG_04899 [Saprolegnia parasitica CBS 223.65]
MREDGLADDLVQRIAECVETSADMRAYVLAMPLAVLTSPLAALRRLYEALDARVLTVLPGDAFYPQRISLWPQLRVPQSIPLARLRDDLTAALPLYPWVVQESIDMPLPFALRPHTKIKLRTCVTPAQLGRLENLHNLCALDLLLVHTSDRVSLVELFRHLPAVHCVSVLWRQKPTTAVVADALEAIATSASVQNLVWTMSLTAGKWDEACRELLAAFLSSSPLTSVSLRGLNAGPMAATTATAVVANASIARLELHDARVISTLFQLAPSVPSHWTSLRLHGVAADDLPRIASAVTASRIRHLSIALKPGNIIVDEDERHGSAILAMLSSLPCLQSLDLSSMLLPSVEVIAAVLPQLVQLGLSENDLHDDGVVVLARALPLCRRLRSLRLRRQGCSDAGAVALASTLSKAPSLRTLDVSGNCIGSKGGALLAAEIPQLLDVDLSNNQIGYEGALALSRMVPKTTHMENINLEGNPLYVDGVLAIVEGVARSPYRVGSVQLSRTLANPSHIQECLNRIGELPDPAWCIFLDT